MEDLLLRKYCTDRSPQAASRLMDAYYPLVYSVCRRYLRRSQDVEDAAQDTFLKLLRHADAIHGDVRAWLTTTAYSTSIDLIRRANSGRKREQSFRHIRPAMQQRMVHDAIHTRLHEALLKLDAASSELLIERFVRKTPLRVIAGRQNAALGTISRQTSRAVAELAAVLREMGVASADDFTVAEHFGDPTYLPSDECEEADGLRFAPDWRAVQWPLVEPGSAPACLPGWTRPLRIGAFISHLTLTAPDRKGKSHPLHADGFRFREAWLQIGTLAYMAHPGYEFVGIVERGSAGRGQIEQVMRDYDVVDGLVEACDSEGLATLDVILLGNNWAMLPAAAAAVHAAVRSGVGLLNDCCWTDLFGCCDSNEDIRALTLAESATYRFHTKPVHETPMPVIVHEEHPILPGLRPGISGTVPSCGPVYQARRDAKILLSRSHVVMPEEHELPNVGPLRSPLFIVGQLGIGRVAVVNVHAHKYIVNLPGLRQDYMDNLLGWLAEPHREAR